MKAAREDAGELAECFLAFRGSVDESIEDYVGARVAARRFAEFVNLMIAANSKR